METNERWGRAMTWDDDESTLSELRDWRERILGVRPATGTESELARPLESASGRRMARVAGSTRGGVSDEPCG